MIVGDLESNRSIMYSKKIKKIDDLFQQGKWKNAREIILKELKNEPQDHWLLTRLSTTYYEERKYDKALKYAKQAYEISPDCPLVLWDYACVLDMLEKEVEAIALWEKIISFGVEKVAFDVCGEGVRWAESIINDSRYRISLSCFDLGHLKKARVFIESHLKNRKRGLPSLYTLKEISNKYKEIMNKLTDSMEQ